MTSFWFMMFWFFLIMFIGSGLGIMFRKKIGKQQQKEKSIVGIDFHNRRRILNEQNRR